MPNVSGLTTDARAAIAFKKLLGLANTSTYSKAFYNEGIASQISIFTNEIVTEEIPEDPSNAGGIVEQVDCELNEISGTDGYAWNIVFPSGYSSGNGYFSQNDTASDGDPVRDFTQIIPNKFNVDAIDNGGYGYILYDNNGDRIGVTDSSRWQVDPVSGIVKTGEFDSAGNQLSTLNLGSGGYLRVYLYTGEFLKETLDNIATNAGNIEIFDDGSSETTSVESIDFSTNLSVSKSGDDVTVTNDIQTTDDLPEGNNEYYSTSNVETDVENFLSPGTNINFNSINNGNNLEIENTRTDENIQDLVGTLLSAGTGEISVDYQDSNDTLVIDNTRSNEDIEDIVGGLLSAGGGEISVDYQDSNDTLIVDNTRSDDDIQSLLASTLVPGSNVSFTDDIASNDEFIIAVTDNDIQDTAWDSGVLPSSTTLQNASSSLIDISYDSSNNNVTLQIESDLGQYNNNQNWISDLSDESTEDLDEPSGGYTESGIPQSYSNSGAHPYFTKDRAQDAINEALNTDANGLLTVSYSDSNNVINFTVESDLGQYNNSENWISNISNFDTTDLDEPGTGYNATESDLPDTYSTGGKHPYLTLSRVRAAVSANSNSDLNYNQSEGEFEVFKYNNFDNDFATKRTNDLNEPSSVTVPQTYSNSGDHVYFTKERAQDAVNEALEGGTGITVEYNDSTDQLIVRSSGTGSGVRVIDPEGSYDETGVDELAFGADLSVSDTGASQATIDFTGSGGGGVLVEDSVGTTSYDGSNVEPDSFEDFAGVSEIDFKDQLEVKQNSSGAVTVNSLVPTQNIDSRLSSLENLLPQGVSLRSKKAPSGLDEGNVAFDSGNPIPNRSPQNSDSSTIGANISVGDSFEISGARRGIIDLGYDGGAFGGDLNQNVGETDFYESKTFDNAATGTLEIFVNSGKSYEESFTYDLTNNVTDDPDADLSQFDFGSFGGDAGLKVSVAKPLTFPDETAFTDNYQRRGKWRVDTNALIPGYNRIEVRHYHPDGSESDNSGNYDTTSEIYYVLDDDHESVVNNRQMIFSESIGSFNTPSGTDTLSGITYDNKVTSSIDITIDNIYYYTYAKNGVVSVDGTNFNTDSGPYDITDPNSDDMTSSLEILSKGITSVDLIKDGDFIIDTITAQDPVEGGTDVQTSSNETGDYRFLVNNKVDQNSNDLNNYFDTEARRINANEDFNSDFNLGGAWSVDQSLKDTNTNTGYNNGLQSDIQPSNDRHVLSYPSYDYSSITEGPNNPNYDVDTDGVRYYWGWWIAETSSTSFVIKLYGDNGINIVSNDTTFSDGSSDGTKQMKLSVSLPWVRDSNGDIVEKATGWLDVTQNFISGEYGESQYGSKPYDGTESLDGDAASESIIHGSFSGQVGNGDFDLSGGTSIGVTTGQISAGIEFPNNPGNFRKLYYRIIVPQDWNGYLSRATVEWNPS